MTYNLSFLNGSVLGMLKRIVRVFAVSRKVLLANETSQKIKAKTNNLSSILGTWVAGEDQLLEIVF